MIICPDPEFVDGTYTQKQEELSHLHLDSYDENCCDAMCWKEIQSFSALQTTMKEIPHLLKDDLRDWEKHAADSSLPSCLASGLHRRQTALRMTAVTTDFTRQIELWVLLERISTLPALLGSYWSQSWMCMCRCVSLSQTAEKTESYLLLPGRQQATSILLTLHNVNSGSRHSSAYRNLIISLFHRTRGHHTDRIC